MKSKNLLLFLLSLSGAHCIYLDEDCLIFPVYPVQYEITLTPYIQDSYYEGDITIVAISTVNGQNTIELDAKDLEIREESVRVTVDNRNIADQRRPIYVDKARNKVIIYLREGLRAYNSRGHGNEKHQYSIKMRFRGKINMGDAGLFAKSYKEGNDVKWVLSTRLAPGYASSVFPCVDEPRIEAGYIIRVYTGRGMSTALSVSRENRRHESTSEYTLVEFYPSPQIPAYKMGLHLSDFAPHSLPPLRPQTTCICVWTRQGLKESHQLLQNFGNRILVAFGEYMNSSTPVTSTPINVVLVPNYYRSYERSAWNLLIVGENRFILEDGLVSYKQQEQMELELSRQLSRIWLGNSDEVSKTRWKQEWFKEGMATYFGQYFIVWGDTYQRGSDSFGLENLFKAMAVDTRRRPLSAFNITSADVLSDEDEQLMSLKTASIVRMIEHWLDSEIFHRALKDYLIIRQGKTITVNDFSDFLQREAIKCQFFKGFTVSDVLQSWINRPGYPVVNVKIYRDQNVVALSQTNFDFDGENRVQSNFIIPISYITQYTENCVACLQPKFIFSNQKEYTFKENLSRGWIILNTKASGYYRVNYDTENWELIAKTLNGAERTKIDVENRAQIVNDAFALHAAGMLPLELTSKIMVTLQHEEDLSVWEAAFQGFELMKKAESTTRQSYEYWKNLLSQQISTMYYKVKNSGTRDPQARLLYSRIVTLACSVELPACVEDMKRLPGAKCGAVEPDLRAAYYSALLRQDNGWHQAKRLLDTCSQYEKEEISAAKYKFDYDKAYYKNLPYSPENIELPTSKSPQETPGSAACCNQALESSPSPHQGTNSASEYSTINLNVIIAFIAILSLMH